LQSSGRYTCRLYDSAQFDWAPPTESSNPEPGIEITPLDDHDNIVDRRGIEAFEIPREVPKKPGLDRYSALGIKDAQLGGKKSLQMKRGESACQKHRQF
jgi:hypothetical protein